MTAPATRTATDLDISDCPECAGHGRILRSMWGGVWGPMAVAMACSGCNGTGQRHTVTECDECAVPMLVPWSVDHTLAPLRCDSCAAVCNATAARVAAGRR